MNFDIALNTNCIFYNEKKSTSKILKSNFSSTKSNKKFSFDKINPLSYQIYSILKCFLFFQVRYILTIKAITPVSTNNTSATTSSILSNLQNFESSDDQNMNILIMVLLIAILIIIIFGICLLCYYERFLSRRRSNEDYKDLTVEEIFEEKMFD